MGREQALGTSREGDARWGWPPAPGLATLPCIAAAVAEVPQLAACTPCSHVSCLAPLLHPRSALMGSVDPVAALASKTISGGRLNVARALAAIQGKPLPASPAPQQCESRVPGRAAGGQCSATPEFPGQEIHLAPRVGWSAACRGAARPLANARVFDHDAHQPYLSLSSNPSLLASALSADSLTTEVGVEYGLTLPFGGLRAYTSSTTCLAE